MLEHDVGDLTEIRLGRYRTTGKDLSEITEEPRTSQATPADGDSIAAGLIEHSNCIFCSPNIAIADNRN